MLNEIDLSRKVPKAEYRTAKDELELRLGVLQRQAKDRGVPLVVVFEGWDAAGKGTLINELILPLDPRGFSVCSTFEPTEEERLRPFLWRFWNETPARGRIAIFDRSWYWRVVAHGAGRMASGRSARQAYEDICSFERQLADDGNVIVKLFLHMSKKEQKRRFEKLQRNKTTAWRVSKDDLKRHKRYDRYLAATEEMLAQTDSDFAPWTVIEAHDRRFAALKMFHTVIGAVERGLASVKHGKALPGGPVRRRKDRGRLRSSILEKTDLSRALDRESYRRQLKRKQDRLRELEHQIYMRRVPVVVIYEGWDAAGKGGNIRRLTQELDPRGYEVVPVAAPNDVEKAHHYLWRFWREIPKAGHMTIFDRSWYGRVLVERVEGFCTEQEWRRAYREINEMEEHLTGFGVVLLKFWLQIDPREQLKRFRERERLTHKQWKMTAEDWRNRKKWNVYEAAVEEMLLHTSTPAAPWTVVESNCKWYARVKVLATVIRAIEKRLKA